MRREWLFLVSHDNVFVRLLSQPAVGSTCEVIERLYASTKQTQLLLCSVCGVYEMGARTTSSLAVLACKGLDHLEEKIPALQYPPEKARTLFSELI
ncbi:unnamed protein product [Coregonus sp. 'balchen']|nr:unnamed protein product [Coregonus sp. 'balchen']